ncbi:UNVERIFIED_ORG: enoyl-CoA hydratase/carnithine racemase [Burkholderia sp. CF145]|jgi:enoyl-CoA hydratase/carnithine racemase|uniref:enoyl-CoA hydratase/isomerase family protein n=1 Tax=Paraburkholderia hospita TaxID=169430 RepID=UPI00027170ED|nr:enoyl-CoA hydratase/isomerase family protein [Paraburkholderia hospita]EUC20124.1 Enoyl-CoA hydratase/isomerase [Burkholderia sp. BT03]SKD05895.1 Enoyl-CoA hydratase/carnithine racemase [Paraburkholderia hospita]
MSTESVAIRRKGALLDIVLDRPENGNLIDQPMSDAIIAAVTTIDDDTKLVRIVSSGKDFCKGRQSPMPPQGAKPSAETLRRVVAAPPLALYDALKAVRVPVLSVVRGEAIGVGCALAGVCDVSLAADDAIFQIPEMERDIPPTLVMSALIGRVPVKTVAHMVLSRVRLSAQEALVAGLVSRVVPVASLDDEADALTDTLLGCSAVTLRAVKQFLHLAPDMPAAGSSGFAAHLAATALSARF